MTEEDGFLRQILADPADDAPRLVYADWLEERIDPESLAKGQFLRVECELAKRAGEAEGKSDRAERLRTLAQNLQPRWLAVVSRPSIENCGVAFTFRCPKEWGSLRATDDPGVRFCDQCRREVFFCDSIDQARTHAWLGECLAVTIRLTRRPDDLERPPLGDLEPGDLITVGFFDIEPEAPERPLDEPGERRKRRRRR